jgi:hypothetical protein
VRLLRIALLSALLVAVGASAASASDPPHQYYFLTCQQGGTGEILGLSVSTYSNGATYHVTHTITPCEGAEVAPDTAYAAAIYFANGTAVGAMKPYPVATSVRTIGVATTRQDSVAVCLITSWNYRVACAAIVSDGAGAPALGPPLPIDAPIVSVPAVVPGVYQPQLPLCPTCAW